MSRCVLVGDVPAAVAAIAAHECDQVDRHGLEDTVAVTGDRLILHVPANPDLDACQDWLLVAAASNARVGLTSAQGLTVEVMDLLFFQGVVRDMRLLNDGDAAVDKAVRAFLRPDSYQERPKQDDVPLDRFFTWTADSIQYRKQRLLSLFSDTMEGFLRQLRDAVVGMQAEYPLAVARLPRKPPWDPNGPLTEDKALPLGAVPSLGDVFRLHDTPQAQRLLHPGDTESEVMDLSEWRAPNLLIRGESGSGKTLVAEIVRDRVARGLGVARGEFPYVTVNCAALRAQEIVHELFGAVPGVWSGIDTPVPGQLAKASYGVAFLDEIGDLDPSAQRAMLVFLQDRIIRPAGMEPFPGFVRIIAATNRDVPLLIERQQFRHDLHARFDFSVEIPPLRDRGKAELERLVEFAALNPQYNPGLAVTHISRHALDDLATREYRNGNFRELETVVHAALGQARRRGSACVRTRDVDVAAEALTVLDRRADVIRVDSPPAGPMLDVKTRGDIARAAGLSRSLVLEWDHQDDATGQTLTSQYVVADGYTLRHTAPQLPGRPVAE
jgi:transcriptional regulator of acetoin/glycerol metabolism